MTLHMSEITYKGHTTTFKISNFFDIFLPKNTPLFFRRKYFLKQSILTIKERFFFCDERYSKVTQFLEAKSAIFALKIFLIIF